jgi:hypothetical protein
VTPRIGRAGLAFLAAGLVAVSAPGAHAQTTVCDTDPNAVPFEATVDASGLNGLLALLGNITVPPPSPPPALSLGGVCVTHKLPITMPTLTLPLASGGNLFTVETDPGQVRAILDLRSPFEFGIDGSDYQAVDCKSLCVIEVPYIGTIFNGCTVEETLVGPLLGLIVDVGVSWDSLRVTQTADTCVLGDCTPVHPLASTQASLAGFDVDATGFGDCGFCLDFPEPFDFLDVCFNPCDGIDGILTDLIRPVVEGAVEGVFGVPPNQGLLIQLFSLDIVTDGCADIPEVRDCKNRTQSAGLVRRPRDYGLNWALYSLPLVFSVGLTLRLRRRGLEPPD